MKRFTPALVVSTIVVGMAPFAGEIRDWISETLGGGFVRVMGAAFAVVVAAIVVWVIARIRDDRVRRYGLLLLGLALLIGQLAGWSRANAAVNAVERIHFLYYGLLGVLWLRAFRRGRADLSAPLLALVALLLVAIADEGVQWWVAARTGELYDIALNVYAGATGILVGLALDGPRSLRWRLLGGGGQSRASRLPSPWLRWRRSCTPPISAIASTIRASAPSVPGSPPTLCAWRAAIAPRAGQSSRWARPASSRRSSARTGFAPKAGCASSTATPRSSVATSTRPGRRTSSSSAGTRRSSIRSIATATRSGCRTRRVPTSRAGSPSAILIRTTIR